MKLKRQKKLTLTKTTICTLTAANLAGIRGGDELNASSSCLVDGQPAIGEGVMRR